MKISIWKTIPLGFCLIWTLWGVTAVGTQRSLAVPVQSSTTGKQDKEAVCDGAMEIIPSGQMSFSRKRYIPTRPKSKTPLAKPRTKARR